MMDVLRVAIATLAMLLAMAAVSGCANTTPQQVNWSTGGGPENPS